MARRLGIKIPGDFAGVRAWKRFHRRNGTQAIAVKGDKYKYLHRVERIRREKADGTDLLLSAGSAL